MNDPLATVLARPHRGGSGDAAGACAPAPGVDAVTFCPAVDGEGLTPVWSSRPDGGAPKRSAACEGSTALPGAAPTRGRRPAPPGGAPGPAGGGEFGFPLRPGALHVGVMAPRRTAPGPPAARPSAEAPARTPVLTTCRLSGYATELLPACGPSPPEPWEPLRAEAHQAAGMAGGRLGVPPVDSLLRLRAHAYARVRPLPEVAGEVVARRPRSTPDTGTETDPGPQPGPDPYPAADPSSVPHHREG